VIYTNYNPSVEGIAFAPDGTLYTAHSNNEYVDGALVRSIRKWAPPYTSSEVIGYLPYSGNFFNDVDYWNGKVYAAGTKSVYVYDGNAFNIFVTGSPNNGGSSGFLAFIVPEPGTLVLLAGGLLGLFCYAWRKRK